jgi:hypothetical protein
MPGFVSAGRGLFVSAKGPKTLSARARPQGVPPPSSRISGSETRCAQTVLAKEVNSRLRLRRTQRGRAFQGTSQYFQSKSNRNLGNDLDGVYVGMC